MTYSLAKITTKADCDELIADVQKEKSNLEFQQTALQHQEENFDDVAGFEGELGAITTELTGLSGIIATLGDGKTKDGYLKRQAALTLRKIILTGKKDSYGVTALIKSEFEQAQTALQITEAATLIAALEARKAELPA